MSHLDIPDHAMDAAWRTFADVYVKNDHDLCAALADAITAAAPLIAAAELRRLATTTLRTSEDVSCLDLLRRADELDPPGGAS